MGTSSNWTRRAAITRGRRFTWRLLLVCGDPMDPGTHFGGYDKSQVSAISCPGSLAFDSYGNLWLATERNALATNDGLFAVPLEGSERGHVKQFLTVPIGAAACGPTIDPYSVIVSVQHPGESGSIASPASRWPDSTGQARPSVAVVYKPGPLSPSLIGE